MRHKQQVPELLLCCPESKERGTVEGAEKSEHWENNGISAGNEIHAGNNVRTIWLME